ncbi:MAG: vitamin K epoxide reductase family protein [Candidatus Bipolaricaulota bacterium]|nr:vitamin K epoxide reductase family protein [Candidatus Bipolaricaulota bacterium]
MWRLWGILVLAMIGLGVAGYLTYEKFAGGGLICWGSSQECEIVQNSPYSQIGPIPVAVLGLLGYLIFLVMTVLQIRAPSLERRRTLAGLNFGLALGAFLYSGYLTYLELFVIYAICTWCVISAILVTFILVLATWELVALTKEPQAVVEPVADD